MSASIINKNYKKVVPEAKDFLPINGTDYLEMYVGDAKKTAHYFTTAFGFKVAAFAGLETGRKDSVSYVLQQNKIRLVVTSPLTQEHAIWEHLQKHGDGVKVIALWVDDAENAYNATVKRGAKSYFSPKTDRDEYGIVKTSGIHTYGDTVHIFVERKNYSGEFLPGFKKIDSNNEKKNNPPNLLHIDHVVGNVDWGEMNKWCKFYADTMGFAQLISFDDKDISTEYTALMSKVMSNGNGYVKFPINEPAKGKKKSQIEEYVDFYNGAGVQHIAIATDNIIETIKNLRERGVDFLNVPDSYYDDLTERVGEIDEDVAELRKLKILVDRDDEGYLLQLFTKPIVDRPTLFIEIIERKGAQSFGKGNFKALFEAIEAEQSLRGTL